MKKSLIIGVMACGLLFLNGCAQRYYLIQTQDGEEYLSYEAPSFDHRTQSYKFTDDKGNKVTVNRDARKVMVEKND